MKLTVNEQAARKLRELLRGTTDADLQAVNAHLVRRPPAWPTADELASVLWACDVVLGQIERGKRDPDRCACCGRTGTRYSPSQVVEHRVERLQKTIPKLLTITERQREREHPPAKMMGDQP